MLRRIRVANGAEQTSTDNWKMSAFTPKADIH
jgi:hypothetical protein